MRGVQRAFALTITALSTIPQRLGASLVTVIAVTTVMGVLITMLALGEGLDLWKVGVFVDESPVTVEAVMRAGHLDNNGNFVAATVPINDGASTIANRSIINDRALLPQAQEHIPDTENIRALRAALNTLGDGFVEAIDDHTLNAIAQHQVELSGGRIHGEAVEVPVLEAPGQSRIGRFGWKDQHSSLLSFIGDAYLNEMGVTNRLRPNDVTTIGKITPDPEDVPDNLGLADIDHFAQFIRGTKVPPRDVALAATAASRAGDRSGRSRRS